MSSSRLYVGNLSFLAHKEMIREVFAKHGTVSEVHIPTNRETGESRGFAFVTMSTAAEATKAIAAVDGLMLDGRLLRVAEARERT